ncbi:MAG: hypothetical protein H6585_15710 [Flavobacteriales bacterium]|nr:hypothetical protein [Flavobacteriales bacterium]MCB9449778.1 hypothetical protein [Flavobacteriales bacterium]
MASVRPAHLAVSFTAIQRNLLRAGFGLILFFLQPRDASAQSNWNRFWHISGPERCWAIRHPFTAGKCLRLTKEAKAATHVMASSDVLDHDISGGQVDAFRHGYWMALLSSRVSTRKARSLGKAHERGNRKDFKKHHFEEGMTPDRAAGEMDTWNNEQGILIGNRMHNAPEDSLQQLVIRGILAGDFRILAKDGNGNWLNCNGQVLSPADIKDTWENDKCLVPSNQRHE